MIWQIGDRFIVDKHTRIVYVITSINLGISGSSYYAGYSHIYEVEASNVSYRQTPHRPEYNLIHRIIKYRKTSLVKYKRFLSI